MLVKIIVVVFILSTILSQLSAQLISVDEGSCEEEYKGTGIFCISYLGQYLRMWNSWQLGAFRMLYEELVINYVKFYSRYRAKDNPDRYNDVLVAIGNAKVYNHDLTVLICTHNLPGELKDDCDIGDYYNHECGSHLVSDVAIARHMIDLFNIGGNVFLAFLTNSHKFPLKAGLFATTWNGKSVRNSIFYGFKHLSATHSLYSGRVTVI
ncbi:hypothetical protein [Saccharicrinis fermentans]|uniref:Uncharacterized protein n=1 Tax=Saccharicrinis fermentans DSM 9555 = JCM 21142 TaxID=869213 RepID=W7Y9D0_9BACT|nr:hypothetical protein [Saccharicrinis fermentans]GAF04093.1 hypothetical protein JCM21142_72788 [Saccharicrinis fermentans DSM 9555 = JCM 21142]